LRAGLITFDLRYIRSALRVADPGCLSRIPDPNFYSSEIPGPRPRSWILDLGSDPPSLIQQQQQKEEREKLNVFPFYSNKFHKIVNYFLFELVQKENPSQLTNNYCIVLFTRKIVTKLSKIWVGMGIQDRGSEIRVLRSGKNYPGSRGVKKAPDPVSHTRNTHTMHCKIFVEGTIEEGRAAK
jgi:hypothetical protein